MCQLGADASATLQGSPLHALTPLTLPTVMVLADMQRRRMPESPSFTSLAHTSRTFIKRSTHQAFCCWPSVMTLRPMSFYLYFDISYCLTSPLNGKTPPSSGGPATRRPAAPRLRRGFRWALAPAPPPAAASPAAAPAARSAVPACPADAHTACSNRNIQPRRCPGLPCTLAKMHLKAVLAGWTLLKGACCSMVTVAAHNWNLSGAKVLGGPSWRAPARGASSGAAAAARPPSPRTPSASPAGTRAPEPSHGIGTNGCACPEDLGAPAGGVQCDKGNS